MYDFAIGLFESIVKHGLSWSTAAAVLFLILKQRKMKRKLKKYLPHLFADDEPNTHYINNQITIMENQRRMMERMKLEWNAPITSNEPKDSPGDSRSRLAWQSATTITALFTGKSIQSRRKKKMKSKWKSRKFWMSIIAALLVVANEGLDLGISTETVTTFAALVASFIFSEAYVDGKKKTEDILGDSGPAE